MSNLESMVLITVPKFVSIAKEAQPIVVSNKCYTLPKIKPLPLQSSLNKPDCQTYIVNMNKEPNTETNTASKGKKRRLDHLTWEEKIQRKKLKNRVAAQTSRDRKKARMEEMESEIKDLKEQNDNLESKYETLRLINESLLEKNQKLDREINKLRGQLEGQKRPSEQNVGEKTCENCAILLHGSAVSINTDPLQQGSLNNKNAQATQSLQISDGLKVNKLQSKASLWRVIALCLLYMISYSPMTKLMKMRLMMLDLIPADWKNLPKGYSPISPPILKQAIEQAMYQMPKFQAQYSNALDQWWGPHQKAWNPTNLLTPTVA